MATWEDLDEEEDAEIQKKEIEVANICFMANIEDEATKIQVFKHELSYD